MMNDLQSLVSEIEADRRLLLDTMSRFNSWDVEGIREQWLPMMRTRLSISDWDKCWPTDTKKIKMKAHVESIGGTIQSMFDLISGLGWESETETYKSYLIEVLTPARERRNGETGTGLMSAKTMTERLMSMPSTRSTLPQRSSTTPPIGGSVSVCPILESFRYNGNFNHDGMRSHEGTT